MRDLISTTSHNANYRRHLLLNVSVLTLLGATYAPSGALAASADEDRPTVWIELGGQLERLDTEQSILAPAFFDAAKPAVLRPMVDSQRPSRYSPTLEGKITFVPESTNWVLSAELRYGQVKNARHLHYETPGIPPSLVHAVSTAGNIITPTRREFGDGQTSFADSHFVLDFSAGKDVGLGLFGDRASSVVSAGVRFAQFSSHTNVTLHAQPIVGYSAPVHVTNLKYHGTGRYSYRQFNTAVLHSTRNTHVVGPSVSWDGSVPVIGDNQTMTVVFDWGVNAAALFGRQRTHEDHRTTGYSSHHNIKVQVTTQYNLATAHDRSRSVFVPNIGGFAGLSLKFPNAKISLGYRGDFFLNATDIGIDARNEANRNFYGPFATISIGLGG